jgi:hypothetical protein
MHKNEESSHLLQPVFTVSLDIIPLTRFLLECKPIILLVAHHMSAWIHRITSWSFFRVSQKYIKQVLNLILLDSFLTNPRQTSWTAHLWHMSPVLHLFQFDTTPLWIHILDYFLCSPVEIAPVE